MKDKTQTEIKLEKGCGKKISYTNYHLYCGDSNSLRQVFCQECKAKLSQHKADIKAFVGWVKGTNCYTMGHILDKDIEEGLKSI